MAWEKIFSGDLTEDRASAVANMFDDDDFLQSRQFTVLHKIVLGLIPKKLQDELEYSTKDIDAIDSSGRTCVSWAASRGDEKSLETLLRYGGDPNLPDTQGAVPLHHVKDAPCCNLLLAYGADIAARNIYGHTALHAVTRGRGSLAVLDTLVNAGIEINDRDKTGETALCNTSVCIEKYTDCVKYLLDHGADMGYATNTNDTLLQYAIMYNAHDIMHLLFARKVDYTLVNLYGQNILHLTARLASTGTVRLLKHYGLARLDIKAVDHAGKSAEDYLQEREDDSTDPCFRTEFKDLLHSIEASQRETTTLISELAALDIEKGGTVTCLAPISVDSDDDDNFNFNFSNESMAHSTPVFYDALEQPMPVEIRV